MLNLNEDVEPVTTLFQPPCKWNSLPAKYRSENCWSKRNIHGLSWYSGDVSYNQVQRTIRSLLRDARRVFVKGMEKKQWLQNIMPELAIVDMNDLDTPSLQKLNEMSFSDCQHHFGTVSNANCATHFTKLLKKWYYENYASSRERAIKMFFNVENLSMMSMEDIAHLTKDFLIIYGAQDIEQAWDKLPESLKTDADIIECRTCQLHSGDGTAQQMIKNCLKCRLFY